MANQLKRLRQILDELEEVSGESNAAVAADHATAAANTAVVITYAAAAAGLTHVISGIAYSFSGAPTGSTLKVADGAAVIFEVHASAVGPQVIVFDPPKAGTAATALTITLSAGGAGVIGMLNVLGHWVSRP